MYCKRQYMLFINFYNCFFIYFSIFNLRHSCCLDSRQLNPKFPTNRCAFFTLPRYSHAHSISNRPGAGGGRGGVGARERRRRRLCEELAWGSVCGTRGAGSGGGRGSVWGRGEDAWMLVAVAGGGGSRCSSSL